MLLFKRKFWDAIRRGEKTQTLRNWKSQHLKPGQKDTIPGVGPIWIDSVEKVSLDDLTDADAIPDGFPTIDALKAEIREIYGDEHGGNFFRVRFHVLRADELEKRAVLPVPKSSKEKENAGEKPLKNSRKKKNSLSKTDTESNSPLNMEQLLVPQSREMPAVLKFVKEIKQEFDEKMKDYLYRIESQKAEQFEEEPEMLTEEQIVEKMVRRCRINRCVCDWNHEPGKSQDFFALFLRSPRDEHGVPTLDGFRLRSLMRDFCDEDTWREIDWIASEICSAWTEWQYAIEHWMR